MEHVNADIGVEKVASGEGEKFIEHIAAEEKDAVALIEVVLLKIGDQISEINAREDINDADEGIIGEITLETVDIPAICFWIIDPRGIFDDAVRTAVEGAEARLVGKGKNDGVGMVGNTVDEAPAGKEISLLVIFLAIPVNLLILSLWRNSNRKSAVMTEKIINKTLENREDPLKKLAKH